MPVDVTTPAASRAVNTLAECKLELGIADADVSKDVWLDSAREAAGQACERYCGVAFALETVEETFVEPPMLFHGDGPMTLQLTRAPVVALTSLTRNGVALDPTRYKVFKSTGLIYHGANGMYSAWSLPVVATYEAGYAIANMPPLLKRCALMLVVQWYATKGRDQNIIRERIFDIREVDYGPQSGETGVPPSIARFLDTFIGRSL